MKKVKVGITEFRKNLSSHISSLSIKRAIKLYNGKLLVGILLHPSKYKELSDAKERAGN